MSFYNKFYEGNINVRLKVLSVYCLVCTVIPAAGPAVVCTSLWWGLSARTVGIDG